MKEYLNEYKGKNILITGGAGCIGSNLTKALIVAKAAEIIVLDDLSAAERWNIPVDPSVVFIEGSILDDEVLKRAFSGKLDFVFHLAAHFANQNSVDNPETDLEVNGLGTLKVLGYSHLTKVGKFVFAKKLGDLIGGVKVKRDEVFPKRQGRLAAIDRTSRRGEDELAHLGEMRIS